MSLVYNVGPYLLAAVSASVIAIYSWKRSRQVSVITLLWAVYAIIIGQLSFFSDSDKWQSGDWVGFIFFGILSFSPALFLVLLSKRLKKFKRFLSDTPTSALLLTQSYRIGGIFLLMAYNRGSLPISIGLITGVIDILVALSAVFLALYVWNNEKKSPLLVITWASISLLDFALAIMVFFMSFLGFADIKPAPVQLGTPPLVIISLFAMPLGIFVSIYVLERTLKWLRRSPTN
jgi:hypothetical protein